MRYLTVEEVLLIHEFQLVRYGGLSGIRDLSLLESALFRPQATFNGNDLYVDIADKTGAFVHSLVKNHPFVDGNKRTALVSCLMFLQLNGCRLTMSATDLKQLILDVAKNQLALDELTERLRRFVEPSLLLQ